MTAEYERLQPQPYGVMDMFRVGMDRDVPRDHRTNTKANDRRKDVVLNLGPGTKHLEGTIEHEWPEWDAAADPSLPYADGGVDHIYAFHFLEHLADPRPVLRECQRVLRSGGTMNIVVPFYMSSMAFHDFDHKSFYTETCWDNLFRETYYTKGKTGWEFSIGFNVIMGVVERNLALVTQLIRN